jgi:hypothetical protein
VDNYRLFTKDDRLIEEPKPRLKKIHTRIHKLLSRIEPPAYLHSVKGRSYITNAKAHVGKSRLVKLDIRKFFPSTTTEQIYRCFREMFQCEKDTAGLMTNICSYDGHLPTGSPLSTLLAFYTHKRMFDEIGELAQANGVIMTCYVDDITLSGKRASTNLSFEVRKIIKKWGLNFKKSKERIYEARAPKLVTGVIITENNVCLPNARHKKIYDLNEIVLNQPINDVDHQKLAASLKGKMYEAIQIDPKVKSILHRFLFTINNKTKGSV